MPAIGTGTPSTSRVVSPNMPLDGRTSGSRASGHLEEPAELGVPALRVDVVEQRARRVGRVGDVDRAARQLPHQPRVDGAEAQLAARRALCRARARARAASASFVAAEVRIEDEARLAPHEVLRARGAERVAVLGGAPILPHDGAVDGAPGTPVPQDRRLALVRDADAGDVAPAGAGAPARRPQHAERDAPDLLGIVLDPARASGKYCVNSRYARPQTRPRRSSTSTVVPVVPWSIATTKRIAAALRRRGRGAG